MSDTAINHVKVRLSFLILSNLGAEMIRKIPTAMLKTNKKRRLVQDGKLTEFEVCYYLRKFEDEWTSKSGSNFTTNLFYSVEFHNSDRYFVEDEQDILKIKNLKEEIKSNILTVDDIKNYLITIAIHAACANDNLSLTIHNKSQYSTDDTVNKWFNDYIEGVKGKIEEIDFFKFFDKRQLSKKCRIGFHDYDNLSYRLIEIIALCYAIKNVPKEVFLKNFAALGHSAEHYWFKVVGQNENMFVVNAKNDADDEMNKIVKRHEKKWKSKINDYDKQIEVIQKEIDEQRKEFEKTREEFEKRVIGPLVERQRSIVAKAKNLKAESEEAVKTELKTFKDGLDSDVRKYFNIRGNFLSYGRLSVDGLYQEI